MKCADSSDRWSKLREAAFNHLAALKGDPEVEQYFIGYFVDVETGYESDVLTDIANSFGLDIWAWERKHENMAITLYKK